jgi:predicted alpha/beta superfamily hydrolase
MSQTSSKQDGITVTDLVLGEVLQFASEALGEERMVNVYLPRDYDPDSAATYPVIYLLDGGTDEDFIHIAGLIQFSNFPWLDMMPQSILVGVVNVDRKRDFTFPSSVDGDKEYLPTSGHSQAFINFISEELQPLIENRYACSGDRMLIGQSLGGLLASEILYTQQELFNRYMIISPSLWWEEESLLKRDIELLPETSVFIAVGKEGEVMEKIARELNSRLVDVAVNGNQVDFLYFGEQDHANILHLAVYYGIQSFYPKADE